MDDFSKIEWMTFPTYGSYCVRFPELVDGSIEDGHSKDESPICKVDKKSSRNPNGTRELHASGSQGVEEVFQVDPGFRIRLQARSRVRSRMRSTRVRSRMRSRVRSARVTQMVR